MASLSRPIDDVTCVCLHATKRILGRRCGISREVIVHITGNKYAVMWRAHYILCSRLVNSLYYICLKTATNLQYTHRDITSCVVSDVNGHSSVCVLCYFDFIYVGEETRKCQTFSFTPADTNQILHCLLLIHTLCNLICINAIICDT